MSMKWWPNQKIPWTAQDELYAELAKVSNVAALSPQERAVYDETLKQYRDNLACIAAAPVRSPFREQYLLLPQCLRRFRILRLHDQNIP